MILHVPFPQGPDAIRNLLSWCDNNFGKIGYDWDVRPYSNDLIEVELHNDDQSLATQFKLIWG